MTTLLKNNQSTDINSSNHRSNDPFLGYFGGRKLDKEVRGDDYQDPINTHLDQEMEADGIHEQAAPSAWSTLNQLVSNAYQGIINTLVSPFSHLQSLWNRSESDKLTLEQLRSKQFKKIQESMNKPDFNSQEFTKEISQETKTWINNLFDEEIKALGKPPVKFCVATLGSLARQESGPITDLEIALFMEKDTVEARRYFHELSQRVSDRLFLLGEHPDIGGKGMRMDEADNAPLHRKFFARNASYQQLRELTKEAIKNRDWDKLPFEGSRPFLVTPEQFADFTIKKFPNEGLSRRQRNQLHQQLFSQAYEIEAKKRGIKPGSAKSKELKQEIGFYVDEMTRPYTTREMGIAESAGRKLGRNIDFLYGDKAIYNRFDKHRNKHLAQSDENGMTTRQAIALECMKDDISGIFEKQNELFLNGKIGKKIDLKRELYRFVEQMVTNFGFYKNISKQNTVDIVKELVAQNNLSKELGDELVDFINFSNKMRLQQQSVLKRQGFATYLDQEAFDEDKQELETKIQGLEQSIEYQKQNRASEEQLAKSERELGKLKVKLHHLDDMAPGKILSKQDEEQLRNKYMPMLSKFFKVAQQWTHAASVHTAYNKQKVQPIRTLAHNPNTRKRKRSEQARREPFTPAFKNDKKPKLNPKRENRDVTEAKVSTPMMRKAKYM